MSSENTQTTKSSKKKTHTPEENMEDSQVEKNVTEEQLEQIEDDPKTKKKKERASKRVKRNEDLKESIKKKKNITKLNSKKYYNTVLKYKESIKSNLKKNTKDRIRKAIGVRVIEKGATSLLTSVGFNWIHYICKELRINHKYYGGKMVGSELIAFTIKNSNK